MYSCIHVFMYSCIHIWITQGFRKGGFQNSTILYRFLIVLRIHIDKINTLQVEYIHRKYSNIWIYSEGPNYLEWICEYIHNWKIARIYSILNIFGLKYSNIRIFEYICHTLWCFQGIMEPYDFPLYIKNLRKVNNFSLTPFWKP